MSITNERAAEVLRGEKPLGHPLRDAQERIEALEMGAEALSEVERLRRELADTRNELNELSTALQDRKVIDRAKTLLMQRQQLSEEAAYAKLRKTAMDKNLKIVEVAQRMLDVADLLG